MTDNIAPKTEHRSGVMWRGSMLKRIVVFHLNSNATVSKEEWFSVLGVAFACFGVLDILHVYLFI